LARVIEEDGESGRRLIKYHLQKKATYCEGFGRGREWTIEDYCKINGLGPYEKANDVFLDIPFTFHSLPYHVQQDKEVQTMVFEAVFNFDRFFEKYGRPPHTAVPDDDNALIVLVRSIVLNLIMKAGQLHSKV
jgi:hypothetical protein